MTQDVVTTESNSLDAVRDSDANTHAVPAESAEEHMRTIGRVLYDIIQDWRHDQDKPSMDNPKQPKVQQPDVFEGRQI